MERALAGLHAYLADLLSALRAADRRASILDIGCGSGAWLRRVRELGFAQCSGLDTSAPAGPPTFEFVRHDIDGDARPALGQFDVVTCIEVIEHVENVGRLVDIVQRHLKADGIALLTTPNIGSLHARLRFLVSAELPFFDRKGDPTHLMPLLPETLAELLRRRDMVVRAVHDYPVRAADSVAFSRPLRLAAGLLRGLFTDRRPGDVTVYVVAHAQRSTSV
ncbi:MAG: class I SAM-dependent methyltransferase [Gammaproteobacteria bacterium]|nr:class I SAM-dependent methyltransferase [Gammaproteobacteria bacterium]